MKRLLFMACIAMLLLSCANNKKEGIIVKDLTLENVQTSDNGLNQIDSTATKAEEKEPPPPIPNAPTSPNQTITYEDWDKKIIKTANVALELKDYNAYNNNLHASLKRYGAYMAQEEQTQNDNMLQNTVSIKVPVAQFEDLMNSFAGEGIKMLEKRITTEDVTGEIIDTKARTEAKKQVRDQYLGLLKQAKNMKDILQVQQEINTIQEDIESASGRVGFLTHQAAYSTINLRYFQYLDGAKTDSTPSFFTKLKEAFSNGISIVNGILLFFITIWPLVIILIVVLLVWKRKKQPAIKNT